MVRLTDDDRWVRRVARWDEHPESIHPLLQQFVTARLLVSGGGADGATLEVAHEAMFRSWGRLAGWLRDDADALRLRRDLDYSTKSWVASGRDDADLWRGDRLDHAEKLAERDDLALETEEREFLVGVAAGCASRNREARAHPPSPTADRWRRDSRGTAPRRGRRLVLRPWERERRTRDKRDPQSTAIGLSGQARALAPENPALALAVAAEASEPPRASVDEAEVALFERATSVWQPTRPTGRRTTQRSR